jgi:hypothetical protein
VNEQNDTLKGKEPLIINALKKGIHAWLMLDKQELLQMFEEMTEFIREIERFLGTV